MIDNNIYNVIEYIPNFIVWNDCEEIKAPSPHHAAKLFVEKYHDFNDDLEEDENLIVLVKDLKTGEITRLITWYRLQPKYFACLETIKIDKEDNS